MSRGLVSALVFGPWNSGCSRDHFQLDYEVRYRYPKRFVLEYSVVRRYHHVPRHCGPYAQRNRQLGAQLNESQDHCTTRAQVLCLDRWLHFGFSVHIPEHVDFKAGVWRVRPIDCPQKMLLNYFEEIFLSVNF